MKRSTVATLSALVLLVAAAPALLAQAPEWTTWSISEPTRVGEEVLQPGTYRLTVVRTDTSRNFVRVMSEDGKTLFTTALTVPHVYAPGEDPDDTARFVYFPAAEGQPRVLRTWFASAPPGGIGHDFVYDEDYAKTLAVATKEPIVSYSTTVAEADRGTTELHVVRPDARVETWVAPEPRTTIVETRPVAVAETRTMTEERTELPETAGRTPLFALFGLLSLAGAFAFRVVNR
jgi:hypothetical protein